MSILIKGAEMPKTCGECWALDDYGDYPRCRITGDQQGYRFPYAEQIMDTCPLIPVPTHGRLIDADALIIEINDRIEAAIKWGVNAIADRDGEIKLRAEQAVATFCEASLTAKKMPTIIEAEEE